jgi:hypothetical protein
MGHLPEIMSERERQPQSIIGAASWAITRGILHPQVEGIENFAIAKRHLVEDGSVLIYANDPREKKSVPATAIAVEDHLVSINHLVVFVSRRQVDSNLGLPNKAQHYFLMNKWAKSPGVIMIPIVQKKDRWRYPDWVEFNAAAEEEGQECANTSGNVVVITPGGERTPQLQEAKIGFAALFRNAREIAMAMPVAVHIKLIKLSLALQFHGKIHARIVKETPRCC